MRRICPRVVAPVPLMASPTGNLCVPFRMKGNYEKTVDDVLSEKVNQKLSAPFSPIPEGGEKISAAEADRRRQARDTQRMDDEDDRIWEGWKDEPNAARSGKTDEQMPIPEHSKAGNSSAHLGILLGGLTIPGGFYIWSRRKRQNPVR